MKQATLGCMCLLAMLTCPVIAADHSADAAAVAALDTQYQAAVKTNDYQTMAKILADDFVLVLGTGQVLTKSDLVNEAKAGTAKYEHQEELANSQKVRLWGETAVVTAKLWIKGTLDGQPYDRQLWFSDTYARTRYGWKYVFGQASLPLPRGD